MHGRIPKLTLLQASDQAPLDSHSTGPSTRFLAPAVSRTGADGIRRTHIAVANATDASKSEIWTWSSVEKDDGTSSDDPVKHVQAFDKSILALEAPQHLPEHILVVFGDGSFELLDLEMASQATVSSSPATSARLIASLQSALVFAPDQLLAFAVIRFIKHEAPAADSTPAKSTRSKKRKSAAATDAAPKWTAEMDLFGVVKPANLQRGATVALPVDDVLDVALDLPSGFVTVLGAAGQLMSYRIVANGAVEAVKSVQLGNLFLTSPIAPGPARFLLSVGQSFAVLAARTSYDPNALALTLWDARYGVVISEQTLNIPTSVAGAGSSSSEVAITLSRLGADAIGIFLAGTSEQGRSIAYAGGIAVPSSSSLANVVARHATTERYLSADAKATRIVNPTQTPEQRQAAEEAERARAELLVTIESLFATDVAQAEAAFDVWAASSDFSNRKTPVPPRFAARLVAIVLPADSGKPHSAAILRKLLSRGVVSDDGLLSALLARGDWVRARPARLADSWQPLVELALQHVPDLPERSLVEALRAVTDAKPGSAGPTLPDMLARVVVYPSTLTLLRAALRERLRADDLPPILDILGAWLAFHTGLNASSASEAGPRTAPPPLDATLTFSQALLDAHLVTLLQDPRSSEAARRLSESVSALVQMAEELESLRGPLAALALTAAAARASRKVTRGGKVTSTGPNGVKKSARQTAYELSLAVGEYAKEDFVL